MKICGIYKITSPSGKIYIGQSVDILKRFRDYNNFHCKNQNYLYNSLKKHGPNKHKFEILCQCTKDELNNLEIYYIELYQCYNSEYGLNLKEGGHYAKYSEESKNKMSIACKGKQRSEAHKASCRKRMTGNVLSEETKQKLSVSNKGRKRPVEFGERISKLKKGKKLSEKHKCSLSKGWIKRKMSPNYKPARLGHKLTEETKKKLSESLKGRTAPNKGKKHSTESIEKMKKVQKMWRIKKMENHGEFTV